MWTFPKGHDQIWGWGIRPQGGGEGQPLEVKGKQNWFGMVTGRVCQGGQMVPNFAERCWERPHPESLGTGVPKGLEAR